MGLCEFSFPTPNVGILRPNLVVGETNAKIYSNLIYPQFVSEMKVRCLCTNIHPTAFCNHVFEKNYYMPVEKRKFRDIRIKIDDNVGNPKAFKDCKRPARVVLYFRLVFQW